MSAEQNVVDAPVNERQAQGSGEQFAGDGGYETDEDGQRVPHGMGQSKSSRRRRRKRKGKGAEAGGAEGSEQGSPAPPQDAVVPAINAGAAPQNGRHNGQGRGFQPQGGGQQNNAPGGTKRWKKKFRDRDRNRGGGGDNAGNQQAGFTPGAGGGFQNGGGQQNSGGGFRERGETHQPGNNAFKRKGGGFSGGGGKQQRGPRSFVGPMDHSYRAVNGNFTETPPSTMEPYGSHGAVRRNHHVSDSQPIDYSQGRPVPIAPDAETHIYFFIEDLFITAKVQETARKLGVKVGFVKNDKEAIAHLTDGDEHEKPALIVFDLNNANAKPLTLIPKLKTKLKKSASIIGFLSHLQGDLKAKAMEAGCDTVMPRAAFSQNLPNLLRRYGIEESEEANFNQ